MKRLLALLLTLALGFAPVAAYDSYSLKASGAQTAAGNGSSTNIGNHKTFSVSVNVTAGSGTVGVFRVWIEMSTDGGATFFELPCELVLKTAAVPPGSGTANQRDIVNETIVQTSSKYLAKCEVDGNIVRAAWNITGTTPSETFDVLAVAK